jgi:hypothetical protein
MTTMNQKARQSARNRKGRYEDMNRCEFCGKALGDGYHSLSNSSETGIGLVCCEKCCEKHETANA